MNSSSVKTVVELKLNKLEFQNSNRLLNTSQTIVEHIISVTWPFLSNFFCIYSISSVTTLLPWYFYRCGTSPTTKLLIPSPLHFWNACQLRGLSFGCSSKNLHRWCVHKIECIILVVTLVIIVTKFAFVIF